MGPRLEGRGNHRVHRVHRVHRRLQWGRVLKDAEMLRAKIPTDYGRSASMGPRLEGRGNTASALVSATPSAWLQWGRVLKDAEIG